MRGPGGVVRLVRSHEKNVVTWLYCEHCDGYVRYRATSTPDPYGTVTQLNQNDLTNHIATHPWRRS